MGVSSSTFQSIDSVPSVFMVALCTISDLKGGFMGAQRLVGADKTRAVDTTAEFEGLAIGTTARIAKSKSL